MAGKYFFEICFRKKSISLESHSATLLGRICVIVLDVPSYLESTVGPTIVGHGSKRYFYMQIL